jgi:DNA-binding NtrC family response regulator
MCKKLSVMFSPQNFPAPSRKTRHSYAQQILTELAIASPAAGVNDYLRQPFSPHELLGRIKCCLSDPLYREDPAGRETAACYLTHAPRMIGDSQATRSIREYIGRVAATDCNVLITGETGTGKELVAGLIHRGSTPRHGKPLLCIN